MMKLMSLIGAIQIDGSDLNLKTTEGFVQALLNTFVMIRNIGIIIALVFIGIQIFQFICSSGQEKMRHMQFAIYSLIGIVAAVLLPSIINWILALFT